MPTPTSPPASPVTYRPLRALGRGGRRLLSSLISSMAPPSLLPPLVAPLLVCEGKPGDKAAGSTSYPALSLPPPVLLAMCRLGYRLKLELEEFQQQLKDLKAEISPLSVTKVTGGASNMLSKIKVVRTRFLTVISQKKIDALRETYRT